MKLKLDRKLIIVTILGVSIVTLIVGILFFVGLKINTKTIPKGDITVTTQYSKYLVNEEIIFTIHNNFNSTIHLENNCPSEPLDVYRYENNQWVHVHDTTTSKECSTAERSVIVPANGTKESSFKYWQNLFNKPGKYRIVAYVDYYGLVPYTDFEVIDKPIVPAIPALQARQTGGSSSAAPSASASQSTSTAAAAPSTSARSSKTISIAQGTVKIEYTPSTIYVISVTPAPGYTYEGGRSGREVEITFKGNGNEVQLKLSLQNGVVVQRIEAD